MQVQVKTLALWSLFVIYHKVSSNLTTTEKGQGCYYNGQFRHGNWTDGCDFNCSCLNPVSGHYKCTVRCPVYHGLPEGCVLKLPPGEECCVQPDCSSLTTNYPTSPISNTTDGLLDVYTTTTVIPIDTTSTFPAGCVYNGTSYYDTWNIGCEQICTCTDIYAGLFSCRNRCAEFKDIPRGCYLQLPPGEECCKEIHCGTSHQTTTVPQIADNIPNIPQKKDFKNPINIEIQNSVTNTAETLARAEIRKQYERAMNHYEKMLNNVKVTNNINPTVQYKLESKVNTKLDNVNFADRDNILSSYFSRYGPMSLFAASLNRKRERRNLGSNTETRQRATKQQTAELSNTLESIDYLLDHRAKQSQKNDVSAGYGFCVYKGQIFSKDEQWLDDCNNTCVCENALTGKYNCNNRCPVYKSLPPGCTMKPNPANKCCQIPDCHYGSVIPVNQPLLDSAFLMSGTLSSESTISAFDPALIPPVITSEMSNTQPVIVEPKHPQVSALSNRDIASAYSSEPAMFESYRITDTRFASVDLLNNVPGEKILKESFNERVRNRFSSGHALMNGMGLNYAAPGVNSPTDVLKGGFQPEVCSHKGGHYLLGESWNDGCKFICTCEAFEKVTCTNRCRNYTYIPTNCQLTKPHPEECCEVLVCSESMYAPNLDTKPRTLDISGTRIEQSELQPPSGLLLAQHRFRPQSRSSRQRQENGLGANRLTKDPIHAMELPGIQVPESRLFMTDGSTSVRRHRINKPNTVSVLNNNVEPVDRIANVNSFERFDSGTTVTGYSVDDATMNSGYPVNSLSRTGIPVYIGSMVKRTHNTGIEQRLEATPSNGPNQFTAAEDIVIAIENAYESGLTDTFNVAISKPPFTVNTVLPSSKPRIPGIITYSVIPNKRTKQRTTSTKSGKFPFFTAPGVQQIATPESRNSSNDGFAYDIPHFSAPGAAGNFIEETHVQRSGPGCYVNGQTYREGESWKVNCRRRCTCIDELNQGISCRPLCVRWKLPDACILELPAPGKCCHTPKCPSGYQISYPKDYIPE